MPRPSSRRWRRGKRTAVPRRARRRIPLCSRISCPVALFPVWPRNRRAIEEGAHSAHRRQQVLYTIGTSDGKDRLVSEAGAMNIFFVFSRRAGGAATAWHVSSTDSNARKARPERLSRVGLARRGKGQKLELATPPLDGTILPGVTRQSVLDLARSWRAGPSSLLMHLSFHSPREAPNLHWTGIFPPSYCDTIRHLPGGTGR